MLLQQTPNHLESDNIFHVGLFFYATKNKQNIFETYFLNEYLHGNKVSKKNK